ncbi:neo-calmodulin-like [Ylistrum balloti]|uniref:neo-calmodulin-like n=1 Tax=Ylistrum balloti TaxID=509963 RepID=UPI002905ED0B|nr:neo-calmodulin-like [Ylistrum balloti]
MDEFELKCRRVFDLFDLDKDGQITKSEIKRGFNMFNMCPTEEEIQQTMKALDLDESGSVDFNEFKILMRKVDQEEERAKVVEAFKKVDRHRRGYLDKKQFTAVLNSACKLEVGEKFSKEEIDMFFQAVDTDKNGRIEFEEFVKAFAGEEDVFENVRTPEYELKASEAESQQITQTKE